MHAAAVSPPADLLAHQARRAAPTAPGATATGAGRVPTPTRRERAGDESRLRRTHSRRARVIDLAAGLFGLGFGAVLGLVVTAESFSALRAPGGLATAAGRLFGFLAAYLMLVMVLLMARIPALERAAGQDRLARWHRRIGGWPIVLVALHGAFITLGYAELGHSGVVSEALTLVGSYPDVLAAVVAFGLMLLAGVASWRAARARLRYETWWAIHLYLYLALGLAFAHEIRTGASFIGHPLTQALWLSCWLAAAAAVLCCRVGLPAWRSCYHRLRVVSVAPESDGAVSIILAGRKVERLRVEGGQYLQWRFLRRGLWWQAHPYSISALPSPPYLRITAGVGGDLGAQLRKLPAGTRVAIEGPYGTFTRHARRGPKVLLVGAGLGVTPLRSLLEHLPAETDVSMIVRASHRGDLVLHDELSALVSSRDGVLHEVLGPRQSVRFDQRLLRRLVPDVRERDVYVCGPAGFNEHLVAAARSLGVPESRIHREHFSF
jgi:ferredoxin-NADP reductase/DMSO/TMAO reductase YedYZ heme-binding membrane subunit